VIRWSAELLRARTLNPDKQMRYLDTIIATVDRATTLTSHLLAFGRRQPLNPESIDPNLNLDAFAEVLSRTIGSNIEIELDLMPGAWAIEADATQLETALLNAAINARDAMPDGGRLTISSSNVPGEEAGGDMVCISLADTGEGMPPEVLERAFDPFFTTKPVGKGTGLGLSQIHGFAAQSGGRAEIDSEPGRGTVVRILLPRSPEVRSAAPGRDGTLASGSGATVLLVEDNAQVREFAENLLTELDYRVISAANAEAAIAVLQRDKVDLLFSDVLMPGMSGVELANHARRHHPELPVLLASGYSEEVARGAARAFATLAKPYGATSLGAALAAVRAGES
jgi:CheY-like chemotaxis protein